MNSLVGSGAIGAHSNNTNISNNHHNNTHNTYSHNDGAPTQWSSSSFYPGLAAFTDTIDALPLEIIRHFTLLREVDAKACGPEHQLRQYIREAFQLPKPVDPSHFDRALVQARGGDVSSQADTFYYGTTPGDLPEPDITRRSRLQQVRSVITELLLTLDEKVHVISTASEALNKHLVRVDNAYKIVQDEINPVIRDGNPEHWAYKNASLRGSLSQRQAQSINDGFTNDGTNSRGETRREASTRRNINGPLNPNSVDVDTGMNLTTIHDTTSSTKRSHASSRAKKEMEASQAQHTHAPGILGPLASSPSLNPKSSAHTHQPPAKKRKTLQSTMSTISSTNQPAISSRDATPILSNITNPQSNPKKKNTETTATDTPVRSVVTTVRRRWVVVL